MIDTISSTPSATPNTAAQGSALGSPIFPEGYAEQMAKDREDSRQRNARDQRLLIFAEILRARAELSPALAADAARVVYEKLAD